MVSQASLQGYVRNSTFATCSPSRSARIRGARSRSMTRRGASCSRRPPTAPCPRAMTPGFSRSTISRFSCVGPRDFGLAGECGTQEPLIRGRGWHYVFNRDSHHTSAMPSPCLARRRGGWRACVLSGGGACQGRIATPGKRYTQDEPLNWGCAGVRKKIRTAA